MMQTNWIFFFFNFTQAVGPICRSKITNTHIHISNIYVNWKSFHPIRKKSWEFVLLCNKSANKLTRATRGFWLRKDEWNVYLVKNICELKIDLTLTNVGRFTGTTCSKRRELPRNGMIYLRLACPRRWTTPSAASIGSAFCRSRGCGRTSGPAAPPRAQTFDLPLPWRRPGCAQRTPWAARESPGCRRATRRTAQRARRPPSAPWPPLLPFGIPGSHLRVSRPLTPRASVLYSPERDRRRSGCHRAARGPARWCACPGSAGSQPSLALFPQ